ncbi:hypothetical protein SAMN05660199_04004 [Klenkia soli]|uniref:Uncharacterized protein n=1 Tax=Klenkia soli TaxID=1052260 RepID=A0A1H0T2P9_9ACTN|nr:hypothetical protein [Klenkia soli]SDP47828.1 hypothetical protein SAMN05660199_04004 [Klenkia soli]
MHEATPMPTGQQPLAAPARSRSWYQRWQLWTGVAALIAVVLGAAAIGAASVDPTASDQYRQAMSDLGDSEAEVATLHEQVRRLGEQAEDARAESSAAIASASARSTELDAQAADIAAREAAVSATEAVIAANTVGPGTYVVGVDMQPGTYRSESAVSSDCYWAILVSGTNGDDIVENDLPGGGFPTITVSEGQDFKSNRCGNWVLQ